MCSGWLFTSAKPEGPISKPNFVAMTTCRGSVRALRPPGPRSCRARSLRGVEEGDAQLDGRPDERDHLLGPRAVRSEELMPMQQPGIGGPSRAAAELALLHAAPPLASPPIASVRRPNVPAPDPWDLDGKSQRLCEYYYVMDRDDLDALSAFLAVAEERSSRGPPNAWGCPPRR